MMYHVNDNKVSKSIVNVSYWVLFLHCVLSEFFQPYSSHFLAVFNFGMLSQPKTFLKKYQNCLNDWFMSARRNSLTTRE